MLDTFYRQLFRPGEAPPSPAVAGLVGGVLLMVMTFNAAASLQLSAGGLSPLLILFTLGAFLGLFWFAAALFTLCAFLGGHESDFSALLSAILVGLWPLILSGAALSIQKSIPPLGALCSLAIVLGTFITLARSLAIVQSISVFRALLLILVTISLSALAIGGVVVWPLMLLLGL